MELENELRELAKKRDRATEAIAQIDKEIRARVTEALNAGMSAVDVGKNLGVSRARVYQIKNGTR